MTEQDSSHNSEHYTFEAVATSLKIPRENWENPTVRQFIEIVQSAQNLQATLTISQSRNSALWMKSADATPAQKAAHQDARVLRPSLADRYESGDMMLRTLLDILRDGFGGRTTDPNYIRSKLNNAVIRYGLEVISIRPSTDSPKQAEAPGLPSPILKLPPLDKG